jgi:hypothetical protein
MPSSRTIASPAAFLHGLRGTPKTITIDVKGDNALFTKNRGVGTILNDD